MSKAVSGAIEIAVGTLAISTGIGASFGWSLVAMGAGQELSAIATKIGGGQGMLETTRQSAAPRRIIYGTQRVGAVEVFERTSGSSNDQYNLLFVFAAHEVTNFLSLWLDSRECYWAGSGAGWTVRNSIGFGGGCDGQNHIGSDGQTYNFANGTSGHQGVYVEARFGDQVLGDYMESLNANVPSWGPSGGNTPSLTGHSYLYVKCEYNTSIFPNKPNPRATISGKAVYDPRTGETAFSTNWALIVADIIQNTDYGLGDAVNAAQLVAAANICDEQVAFAGAGGGMEARYSCNYSWTTDKPIGDVLNDLVTGAGAKMSYIEGEWYLFPATWIAPSVSFSADNLLAKPTWSAQRKFREKINRVAGTFIASQFPYSISGNGYDSNGWYNGQIQDNFNFTWTPTDYPQFACDVSHGYAADQYLTEDNNVELLQTLDFASVLSLTQAQRLAKIALLRNRQQGSGTLTMGVEALVLQPGDTFNFTWAQRGWANKVLEVQKMDFSVVNGEDGVPQIQCAVSVCETDPSVYVWNATEELTIYSQEALPDTGQFVTAPPTEVVLSSSASTALTQPDGTVTPRIEVTWDTPADVRVASIQLQYQLTGSTTWSDGGTVSVASNVAYISAVAGQQYDVRIRSLRSNGAASAWVEIDGFTAGLVLSVQGQDDGVGIGSLVGEAYSNSTAGIDCTPFTASVGTLSLSILPAGAVLLSTDGTIGGTGAALAQQTLYYVYYADPTYVGGNVTPIATTNRADFLGKLGYFLIDSIITPYAPASTGTGTGARYYPSSYQDYGTRTTTNPGNSYDGDLSTHAVVSGSTTRLTTTTGDCLFQGDPSISLTADSTLAVIAGVTMGGQTGNSTASITAVINGSSTVMLNATATTAQSTFTCTVPANTSLSTISVEVVAQPSVDDNTTGGTTNDAQPEPVGGDPTPNNYLPSSVSVSVTEIYVQS